MPSGKQGQELLGPAWSGRGRPPAGYFTKRTAEDWLRDFLDDARRGVVPGSAATGVSFAEAAEEYLRFAQQDRGCKPSTIRGYRSQLNAHLLPAFGSRTRRSACPSQRRESQSLAGLAGLAGPAATSQGETEPVQTPPGPSSAQSDSLLVYPMFL